MRACAHTSDESSEGSWRATPARYSGLNEINTDSVTGLHVLSTFSIAFNAGYEAAPLVVGSRMYGRQVQNERAVGPISRCLAVGS